MSKSLMHKATLIYLCALLASLQVCPAMAAQDKTYSWSVVPQFTGLAVHRDWTPIIDYMNKNTPYRFKLVLYKSIPDFEHAFTNGEPDIAYMNPYHAVMAKRAQGYVPLVRDGKRELTGILVVRKNSAIYDVTELSNSTISFPSPNAFAASLYMRALLHEKIDFVTHYAKTHSNAYRQVLLGKSVAAGGVLRTLKKERAEVADNLRIIYKTPSTPSHPLTAHARVPKKVMAALQQAFANMLADKSQQSKLKAILMPKPINADYQKDYQFLEKLKLDSYVVQPTKAK